MSNFLLKVSKLLIQADGNSILLLAIVPSPQRRNRANFTLDSVFKFLFSGANTSQKDYYTYQLFYLLLHYGTL